MTLYILRGAPGSGKTTLARKMIELGEADAHFEADMWMVDANGEYCFDPSKLNYCHAECYAAVADALRSGKRVIVSNTFTRRWEIQPYADLTRDVHVIECHGRFDNVHGVPKHKVEQMRERMQSWP